ncbi:MAG: RNA polymerase sigma factor [Saprospiraceae bacterium]|nr:RNA polymerase sigma factor [Saprospiraceae bacterium]
MYNICLRMTGTVENAEDALQNAFVDVFTKMDTFRFESSVGAWIKRIVVNTCINLLKKRRMSFDELNEGLHNALVETAENTLDSELLNVEMIQKVIFQLPEGYRVVFSLYALEGYDHEEIGEILGIGETTSKSQYSRAKAKLRDILQSPRRIVRV